MVTSTNNRLYEEAASETSFVVSNSGSIEVFPVEGSKRRQRLALSQDLLRQKAYRVHFSVSNKSRYFRGCKRSIRWVFGLTNAEAISGKVRRGEEHEIELVWNTKKKKAKLFWNKCMISNLWRQQEISGNVEFSWKTRSGETLRIVSQPMLRSEAIIQYDLLVDGVGFFDLPKARDLRTQDKVEDQQSPDDESARNGTSLHNEHEQWDCQSDPFALPKPTGSLGFRLSMAGLSSSTSFSCGDDLIQDELHSELYTPILDSLRLMITSYLPQTEEMVSRAIINAFFVDSNSLRSDSSSLSERTRERQVTDSYEIEADRLFRAHQWVEVEANKASRIQYEELSLRFFQKQIDDMFVHIRNEELTSDEAARILLSVAAVLGLKFEYPGLPKDTVILNGLNKDTTKESLLQTLTEYGEVVGMAIATDFPRFGFCRFAKLDSVAHLWKAYEAGCFALGLGKPAVSWLGENVHDDLDLFGLSSTSIVRKEDLESVSSPEPTVLTTPHLMAPLTLEDPLLLDSPKSIVQFVATDVIQKMQRSADSSDSNYIAPGMNLVAP